jgi:hypothetical protein
VAAPAAWNAARMALIPMAAAPSGDGASMVTDR